MDELLPRLEPPAIAALTTLASAETTRDSLMALAKVRELLGPEARAYERLLESLARRNQELAHLQKLATTDPLTGVANRRGFQQALDREAARHLRTSEPFAVILLDLDEFKRRNDTHGHAAGDAALVAAARACEATIRTTDVVGRLGGDELAVLLPGSSAEGARMLADRLRAAVEAAELPEGRLRVSLGVAATSASTTSGSARDLMRAADADLYRDKGQRRRRARLRVA